MMTSPPPSPDPARCSDRIIEAPTEDDVLSAARALQGIAIKTPLLENSAIDEIASCSILLKAEMFQRTGSFKFRGAVNRMRQLNEAERKRGVIAYSSGNHAQAVACAAKLVGTKAVIVMPSDAPANKIARTISDGAQIVFYDRALVSREEFAEAVQKDHNAIMVPPNEDRRVLAGAGTVALELIEQAAEIAKRPDVILVPCGGGGLTAATALMARSRAPDAEVYAVEPEQFDDTRRSFEVGHRVSNPPGRKTICDAIMTDQPGELTFSINRKCLKGVLTVSDAAVQDAMRLAFEHYKIVIEPGAAVALAAALSNKSEFAGKTVAAVATGGNVDPGLFSTVLAGTGSP